MIKLKITIMLMLAVLLILCGCVSQPLAEQHITVNRAQTDKITTRNVYVSGAVENDGYITVSKTCDYKTLLEAAHVLQNAYVYYDVNELLDETVEEYIIDFIEDGVTYNSVNVNGLHVRYGMPIEGIDSSVVSKLSAYLSAHNLITNRTELQQALGDDYANNYYKFYISRFDYA